MNLTAAIDANAEREIREARQEATDAMLAYVAARRRLTELESLRELRHALAGIGQPLPDVLPLQGRAS